MIRELPPALRPWETELARLPRDLALSIGPHVARLALAIGPLPASRTGGDGEPDGYGGLGRRGGYERLLMGEWALAELWPDEFDRRAAAGEHVFLELARHSEAGARRTVLLLDAGPTQLGGPRIAHLAALVAFARRAAAAGAELAWGVLQRLAGELHRGIDEAGISALLEARSAYEASPALVESWIERVQPAAADDLWLIGPPALAGVAAAAGAACLAIDDVVEPGARRVQARVIRPGRAPVGLELPLPDPGDCARLLRDPYARAVAEPVSTAGRIDLARGLRFSADGRRVIAFDDRGGFLAWPIPSSARATPGRMRRFRVPPGRRLVAAGTAGKKLLAITERADGANRDQLLLHAGGGRARPVEKHGSRPPVPGVDREVPGMVALAPSTGRRRRALALGFAGELWVSPPVEPGDDPVAVASVGIEAVAAWCPHAGGLTAVTAVDGFYRVLFVQDGRPVLVRTVPREQPALAFIGHDADAYPSAAPIAVRTVGKHWKLMGAGDSLVGATASPGTRAIGVAMREGEPRLLVQDRDERTILFDLPAGSERLHQASAPIAAACASPARPQLAYLTHEGELVVIGLPAGNPVLRVHVEVAG